MGTLHRLPPRWNPWLTKRQLAATTGYSTRSIENMMREGLPYVRQPNGRAIFSFNESLSWIGRRQERIAATRRVAGKSTGPVATESASD